MLITSFSNTVSLYLEHMKFLPEALILFHTQIHIISQYSDLYRPCLQGPAYIFSVHSTRTQPDITSFIHPKLPCFVAVVSPTAFDAAIFASCWLSWLLWHVPAIRAFCPLVSLPTTDHAESCSLTQPFVWRLLSACCRPSHFLPLRRRQ